MTSKRYVLLACILSSSLVGLDGMMTPVAIPAISDDLHVGLAVQQWLQVGFLLPLGSLLLLGGAIGDVYDRWLVFGLGTAGFGAGALLCALAPNAGLLISGRLVQGAAAALLIPGALAIITTVFEGEERSRAIGIWSAWSGLSVIVGPLVAGGLLAVGSPGGSWASWRYVYGVLVPLAAIVVVLIARAAPADRRRRSEGSVDRGAFLGVPAVGGPVFALIQGPSMGWGHPVVIAALIVGLVSAVAFLWWEGRAADPLLPLRLFRNRTFWVLNIATFLLYSALICSGFYTVLFLQQTAGYSPTVAGLAAAVPVMVLLCFSGRVGALADRYGARWFIAGGSLIAGAGILLLLRTDADADFFGVVLPSVLIHGVGLTMLVAPLTAGVLSAAGARFAGVASGVNNAVARIGSVLGVAVVGMIISFQFSAALDRDPSLPSAVVAEARDRPLVTTLAADVPAEDRPRVEQALRAASVESFRYGVGVLGGLVVAAGVITAVGMRERAGERRTEFAAAGCPGGAHHGAHHDLTEGSVRLAPAD